MILSGVATAEPIETRSGNVATRSCLAIDLYIHRLNADKTNPLINFRETRLNEPMHGKINNLHMRKQKRRSASQ